MKKLFSTILAIALLFVSAMEVHAAGLEDIFDAEYYADEYPELYDAYGYDEDALYQHFITYGLDEKHCMSPILDVVEYRETYADLDAAFGDNWDAYVNHWYTYGIVEGRDNGTEFDPVLYVEAYSDIKAAFGDDYEAISNHYLTYGIDEGRTLGLKTTKSNTAGKASVVTVVVAGGGSVSSSSGAGSAGGSTGGSAGGGTGGSTGGGTGGSTGGSIGGSAGSSTGGNTGGNNTGNTGDFEDNQLASRMGFYVDGTTLYDANGNAFVMRGVNHAHTWYTDKLEVSLDALADAGCNTVRIVLSDGGQYYRNSASEVETIIAECKERNMIAVLEVHDYTGSNSKADLLAAAQYFVDIKSALIGEEDYVIINIANEWMGNSESSVWEEAYVEAIPMLREAGLAHTIMADSAGWGQYARCIGDGGRDILAADPLHNVMFSVHMYGTAGGTAQKIENNLSYATDLGLCVCVGEFGYTHSDGDVAEEFLMDYCEDNDIGYLAWSWKGNSGGVEYLDIAVNWDGSDLSDDWGEVVMNGTNGIKETSDICTVFSE